MVALLQRMRAEIEQKCDYVGQDFAEEARKIHRGDSEARGIYGEASEADAEALKRILRETVLPGFVQRCGARCGELFNQHIAPLAGVRAGG